MPREVYNEGRVVGMSAYELYLRHQMSEYPELEPITEREWLASTLGSGCSLILRIPSGTPAGTFETQLPDNSTLCAASNITACVFDGEVALDATSRWATKVISYGPLISNIESKHPTSPGENVSQVPVGTAWTEEKRAHLKEYMKIIDGLVYQPGEWEENSSTDKQPYMDFKSPNLHKPSIVRLNISEALNQDVYVIMTGWVHRPVLAGSIKLDAGALDSIHPWNGDFLGLERFPWAVKVIFTVPTEVMHVLNDKSYIRQLVSGTTSKSVTAKAVVDMDSVDVQTFYNTNDTATYPQNVKESKIPLTVSELNVTGDGAAVFGAYQRKDITAGGFTGENYPPILYGTKVTAKGDQYMVPVDTGAPGTVKVFDNKDKAINYPKVIPNTYAFWHDETNKTIYFIEGDDVISLDSRLETKNLGTASSPKYTSIVKSGDKEVRAISLFDANSNMLNTDGTAGSINSFETTTNTSSDPDKNLTWTNLLAALGANKSIDLIGAQLRRFRRNLPNVTSGTGGILDITGTGESKIAGGITVQKNIVGKSNLSITGNGSVGEGITVNRGSATYNIKSTDSVITCNKPIRSGDKFIEFDQGDGNVLRLYICPTAPSTSGVPVGSIGIGW